MSRSPEISCTNIFLYDKPDIQKQIFTEKYADLLLQYQKKPTDDTFETTVSGKMVSEHAEK